MGTTWTGLQASCAAVEALSNAVTFLRLQFPHAKTKLLGSSLRFPQTLVSHMLQTVDCVAHFKLQPCVWLIQSTGFCSSRATPESKPESWFMRRSLISGSACSWMPGPRVLLRGKPVFLPRNVFFEGKRDNWKRQAGTGTQPSGSDLRHSAHGQPLRSWRSALRGPGEPGHRPDRGLFKGVFRMSYVKIAHNIIFFFFSHIVSIY